MTGPASLHHCPSEVCSFQCTSENELFLHILHAEDCLTDHEKVALLKDLPMPDGRTASPSAKKYPSKDQQSAESEQQSLTPESDPEVLESEEESLTRVGVRVRSPPTALNRVGLVLASWRENRVPT